MRRSWLMVPAAMAVVATGCSGEDIAERVVENRLEAESGEDVDIDFDDGNISIQGEDGEFSIDVDEDGDGNISISGSSEEGDFSIQSEDGETLIESEDGSMVMSSSGDLPDGFPDEVPIPDGFEIEFSQASETPDGPMFIVSGQAAGDPGDLTDDYVAALDDAGYEQVQLTTMPDAGFFTYDDGTYVVSGSIGAQDEGEAAFVTLSVGPSEQG